MLHLAFVLLQQTHSRTTTLRRKLLPFHGA
jgi:hypothetical protein